MPDATGLGAPLTWPVASDDAPMLGDAEVHVWSIELDTPAAQGIHTLSAEERFRGSRFMSSLDRNRFLRRRAALRALLSRYLGVTPRDIAYRVNEFGKPELVERQAREGLSFNTSHSDGVAVVAVGRSVRLGIDVERLKPLAEADSIAAHYFARNEAAAFAALDAGNRVSGFYNAWTRKEAVVKALGGGLSIPLDTFEVSLRPGEPARILHSTFDRQLGEKLRLSHLEFGSGYVGALAAGPSAYTLRQGIYTQ